MPIYEEPTIKNKQYPTMAEAVELVKRFNVEDDKARDSRGLMAVLQRIANVSPRISGHILTRNTALYAYDWKIEADDQEDAKMSDLTKGVKTRLTKIIDIILSNHAQVPLFGAMALELSWQYSETYGANFPKIVHNFLPSELDILSDGNLAIVDTKNLKTPLVKDDTKYFYDNLQPQSRGGAMRSIIFHELLRNQTMQEWSNLNKRMKGIITGTINPEMLQKATAMLGLSESQVQDQITGLDSALKNVGEDNYLKTLNAIDIQMKSIVEGSAGASYSEFKKALDADISVSILGQANTTELPNNGGSRAAVQILNLIRTDILFSDQISTEKRINDFLLLDYKVNVDKNAAEVPYRFRFHEEDNIDYEANARKYETLARIGVAVSKKEFYHDLGVNPPDPMNPDDVLNLSPNTQPIF